MFERFSEKSRCVIFAAKREADLAGASAIASEHIMLGLVADCGSLLGNLGMNESMAELLRLSIFDNLKRGPRNMSPHDLPLGESAQLVVSRSWEEAVKLGDRLVEPQHLLLAILQVDTQPLNGVLIQQGLAYPEMLARVSGLREL